MGEITFISEPRERETKKGGRYFPLQPGHPNNLKEGFEIGPASTSGGPSSQAAKDDKFNLREPNVWPSPDAFPAASRARLENLHAELQDLSVRLLGILARALGSGDDSFVYSWLDGSVSTLRLLHYPPRRRGGTSRDDGARHHDDDNDDDDQDAGLCCTPHTDSGILTLLHQDPTGGLEVRSASGAWVPAPYLPESIVVNVGDLMARVSGGRYVATLHRVRRAPAARGGGYGEGPPGRVSVPFFFEPGEDCRVRSVGGGDEGVRYGDHVRAKMSAWVDFRGVEAGETEV